MTNSILLNEKVRKRLEDLERHMGFGSWFDGKPEKLTSRDLLLLLSCSSVIREEIRNIVGMSAAPPALRGGHTVDNKPLANPALEHELADYKARLAILTTERDKALARAQQSDTALAQLRTELSIQKHQITAAEQARDKAQQELARMRGNSQWGTAGIALNALLPNPALCTRLGLSGLANTAESAIQVVAVLSSLEGIKRLWQAIKEQSDTRRSAPSAHDYQMLENVLAWYNHNWPSKPYQLFTPDKNTPYNYAIHQRCGTTQTGETIKSTWLPGLKDGSGKLVDGLKPVVETAD